MPLSSQGRAVRLRLQRYLGARLGPLAFLLLVVITISAPLAFYVLGRSAVSVQAEATAEQIAEVIRQEALERPLLWKYDTPKILAHIRTYGVHESIARIDVVDRTGLLIDEGSDETLEELARRKVIWAAAPVLANDEHVGTVWVAVSMTELQRDALLLLAAFAMMGAVLAGLMYWLPMRAMGRAQEDIGGLLQRLGESQGALAALNENLEHEVEARNAELSRAYRDLQEKEQNLREMSTRAVGLQEAERRSIARELHDSAAQSLTAIRIHLQLMNDLLGGPSEASAAPADRQRARLAQIAHKTMGMVDDTVEEIRRAVNQLGPAVLDDVGLEQALERAAEDLAETTGLEVECSVELPPKLEAAVETTCYRLVQEAMTNVARHAGGSRVEVHVRPVAGGLSIEVRDDGNGFDLDSARRGPSRGLVGMNERVELLGGTLHIESTPGEGTHVRAIIPA
jgi:signal transduction histidine kinase